MISGLQGEFLTEISNDGRLWQAHEEKESLRASTGLEATDTFGSFQYRRVKAMAELDQALKSKSQFAQWKERIGDRVSTTQEHATHQQR